MPLSKIIRATPVQTSNIESFTQKSRNSACVPNEREDIWSELALVRDLGGPYQHCGNGSQNRRKHSTGLLFAALDQALLPQCFFATTGGRAFCLLKIFNKKLRIQNSSRKEEPTFVDFPPLQTNTTCCFAENQLQYCR